MITFHNTNTYYISLSELAQIHNVNFYKHPVPEDSNKKRVDLSGRINKSCSIVLHSFIIESENAIDQTYKDLQLEYILLTNKLRTLIGLESYNEIIYVIEESTLVNFVDKDSLELIKEAIKASEK